jgi:hypothetical protein
MSSSPGLVTAISSSRRSKVRRNRQVCHFLSRDLSRSHNLPSPGVSDSPVDADNTNRYPVAFGQSAICPITGVARQFWRPWTFM